MRYIPLYGTLSAMVDDDDYDRLMSFPHRWELHIKRDRMYARSKWKDKDGWHTVYMHRLILGVEDPKVLVDHADHDGLNNQKSNLRRTDQQHNTANAEYATGAKKDRRSSFSSQYRGVWRDRTQWRAYIRIDGRKIDLGGFGDNEEAAARAYDQAARKHFGEFANPNFKEIT